jgi:predicted short-subunit dehydrogenase-like oxidoreductase (DUF2520 family)
VSKRSVGRIAIVGTGRMGSALASALGELAGDVAADVHGPFGRGFDGVGFDVVILAVPDGQIADAAALVVDGPLVGHCAGSLGLGVLGEREAFSVHPLMTVTAGGARFEGAGAAIAGSSERALGVARELAVALGMQPVEIRDDDRAAYHAAASIASNFVVTLEDAAESLLATTGADRAILVPLVRAAIDNWAAVGGPAALTGPIARGDDATVARQRAAIEERTPELLAMFDVLAERTRALAGRTR